jgi:penicillin amidase
MNVAGMSIPGIPAVFLGKNLDIAWSSTNLFSDHSDAFRDRLVRDAAGCPTRLCIESAGELHRVEERAESYRVNTPSDGVPDNLTDFTALMRNVAPEAVNVLRVPFRSHGFVRAVTDRSVIDDPNATATETVVVTQQYSGLHGDPGLRGPWLFQRARDVHEFAEGVRALATFSANWVVIDRSGNLAYYTSGELPLRPDLESGDPTARPWEIRDGSGPHNWIPDPDRSQGQVLPFRVLPFEEMPHALNPPAGFLVNANNSPDGAGRDGNLLNQCRPSNPEALYYLGRWHDHGGRAGRITRLLREPLEAGEKLGIEDMKRIQGNTQHLVAERLVPFLAAAWGRAQESGAPPELAALGADPEVAEAVGRLQEWDLTAPTGIPEGYDAADVDGVLDPLVGPEEAEASVAATLFWHWRGALHRNTTRRSLAALGLDFFGGARGNSMVALLSAEPFTGVGEAGVDFFPGPVPLSPGERRDLALLQSVRDALDTLAAAPTFGRSTNQDDYRWGLQNRLVLHHLLGGVFSIPPAGGFQDLGPGLRGLARDGLGRTVNPSFVGSVRVILQAGLGPDHGFSSLAGGASGDPASPHHADRLGRWLTVDLDPMELAPARVAQAGAGEEVFGP